MTWWKWTVQIGLVGWCVAASTSFARNVGDVVSEHVAILQGRSSASVAKTLCTGIWEVTDFILHKSTGARPRDTLQEGMVSELWAIVCAHEQRYGIHGEAPDSTSTNQSFYGEISRQLDQTTWL